MVNQAIWFEGETKFADIILPACTNFERWDISEAANCSGYIPDSYQSCNHRVIVLQQKCIEPLGESKSDYEIFAELGQAPGRLGPVHHGRQDRARLGQGLLPRHRPAQGHHLGGVREEGLLRGARSRRRKTVRRPACAGSPRTGRRTRPTGARHPGTRCNGKGLQTRAARSSSSPPASSASKPPAPSTRSARPWARSTSRAGKATTPPTSTTSTRCSWSRRIPSSASTPWATPRTAG